MKKYKEEFVHEYETTDLTAKWPFTDGVVECHINSIQAPSISINELLTIIERMRYLGADRLYITDKDTMSYQIIGIKLNEINE